MPNEPNIIIPTMTAADNNSIGFQYNAMTCGSTIIPTEIKNTAPKRSLTGVTTDSMRSA